MNDEAALLEALHDDPNDETTWLVLSDLLEEQGRVGQAELTRMLRAMRAMTEEEREAVEAEVQTRLLAGVRPVVPVRVNSIGMELALIPPGSFWLGSPANEEGRYDDEGPRRLIRFTRPFYLGVHPVTQGQYAAVMNANPSAFSAKGEQAALVEGIDTGRHPVERVNWNDAMAFCLALGDLPEERQARRDYRLPTEVQWEYACRGAAAQCSPYVFGKEMKAKYANFRGKPRGGRAARRTTRVGKYPPNGFGLYDMIGNVWEFTLDPWAPRHPLPDTAAPDQIPAALRPPGAAAQRVIKGGSYLCAPNYCMRYRAGARQAQDEDLGASHLGFRTVLQAPAP